MKAFQSSSTPLPCHSLKINAANNYLITARKFRIKIDVQCTNFSQLKKSVFKFTETQKAALEATLFSQHSLLHNSLMKKFFNTQSFCNHHP